MSKSGASRTLAAGGVVWRRTGGELEIAVVHRPKYDDWTLPKGKLEAGERSLLAAVREVGEETGSVVEVGRRLRSAHYDLESGPKSVSYWSMRYLRGSHVPDAEVDQIRWLAPAEAFARVSYTGDREVIADFTGSPLATSTILLIRHAKAGKRADFKGDDRLRPLDKIGRRQARDSVEFLRAFGPRRIFSADLVRCEQTVAPLATKLGLVVGSRPALSDEAYERDPDASVAALTELLAPDVTIAVCSQGGTIPALLVDLKAPVSETLARKGSLWVLSFHEQSLIAADYYPHPQV